MRATKKILVPVIFCLFALGFFLDVFAVGNDSAIVTSTVVRNAELFDEGIRFSCDPARLGHIKVGMSMYLASLGIAPDLVVKKMDRTSGVLVFTLNTDKDNFDTLSLRDRPEFSIRDSLVLLPAKNGKIRKVVTVSKKEILLALLQHGRLTEFSGENCSLDNLKDLVSIRQNIVAWSENLNWVWPDGEAAEWNAKYWRDGTPLPDVTLQAAFGDAFQNQDKYSFGCYTGPLSSSWSKACWIITVVSSVTLADRC